MSVKIFSPKLIDSLILKADKSPRLRMHQNIHQSYSEPCQRLFNAIGEGSYIRPHRHLLDPKIETLIAIKGKFALIEFDDIGNILSIIRFGTEKYYQDQVISVGVEISSTIWHTVIAEMSDSVLLEIKPGPFIEYSAKEFASWAPQEGSVEANHYLLHLKSEINRRISC